MLSVRRILFKLFLLVTPLFLFSCSTPRSKEAYLEKLDNLIVDVSKARDGFVEKDWAQRDEIIDKYTGEYYEKFESEFTLSEKLKIGKLLAKYGYYRSVGAVKGVDCKSIIKEIKEFVENDLSEDVEDATQFVGNYLEYDLQGDLEDVVEKAGGIIEGVIENLQK